MNCPVCDVTLSISSREGVEIDFCPQCRGVWLDRGELDMIVERSHAESTAGVRAVATAPPPPRRDRWGDPGHSDVRARDDRHDPRYAKKKKRKSFIEDIFDF
jgi:Zn-finger nucleic acid-binding protein